MEGINKRWSFNLFKNWLFNTNPWALFILSSLLYILLSFFMNKYIISGELYYNTYADQLSADRINRLINLKARREWIGYVSIPVILLCKILLITLSIEIGAIFRDYKVSFIKIFHVVIIAEAVIIIAQLIRNTFLFFKDFNILDEIYNYYPLSVLNLINVKSLDKWLIYPLRVVNVFTVIYFIVLITGLSHILRKRPLGMLLFSVSTYGLCLLIWIMLIMFIGIYLS
jgi:hypothetical protein